MARTVLSTDEDHLFDEFSRLEFLTRDELMRFKKIPLPRFFAFVPLWLLTILLLLTFAVTVPLLRYFGFDSISYPAAGAVLAVVWAVLAAIHQIGKRQAGPARARLPANWRMRAGGMTFVSKGRVAISAGTGTNPKRIRQRQSQPQ